MPTEPTVPDEAAVEAAARARIAACEYLLQVNRDMGGPFIPPTAIDWLGNGIAERVIAAARPILDAQTGERIAALRREPGIGGMSDRYRMGYNAAVDDAHAVIVGGGE